MCFSFVLWTLIILAPFAKYASRNKKKSLRRETVAERFPPTEEQQGEVSDPKAERIT